MNVPRDDWDRPPWNRWSFQHVRDILPTADVSRGLGAPHIFPSGPGLLDEVRVPGLDGQDVPLGTLLEDTFTDGFMVLKHGAIVCERYFNGMTASTLHLSQSVAKSFVGALAGILVGRGMLSLAAPISDYLPELANTGWKGATLQHVLDMTTGVKFSEVYTDPYSDIGQVDVACGWKPIPKNADPSFKWPADMWELILGLKAVVRPHGEKFEYRSIETDVLAFCLERVTGKRLPQILSEEIWQKMGAQQDACFTIDSAGFATADGGLNACLRDYARFGQLMLENGGGIIPTDWVKVTRVGVHGRFEGRYAATLPNGAYRNTFWIDGTPNCALLARGVFGQLIYINHATGVVVAKVSSWPEFVAPELEIATLNAIRAIENYLNLNKSP
jgi:CubicO group peptidase (beta-lactamase class C family)